MPFEAVTALLRYAVVSAWQDGRFLIVLPNQCVWQPKCLLRYPYMLENRYAFEATPEAGRPIWPCNCYVQTL